MLTSTPHFTLVSWYCLETTTVGGPLLKDRTLSQCGRLNMSRLTSGEQHTIMHTWTFISETWTWPTAYNFIDQPLQASHEPWWYHGYSLLRDPVFPMPLWFTEWLLPMESTELSPPDRSSAHHPSALYIPLCAILGSPGATMGDRFHYWQTGSADHWPNVIIT